jgi:hypothetical protein
VNGYWEYYSKDRNFFEAYFMKCKHEGLSDYNKYSYEPSIEPHIVKKAIQYGFSFDHTKFNDGENALTEAAGHYNMPTEVIEMFIQAGV